MKFSKKAKIITGVFICLLTILSIGVIYIISQINKFEISKNDDYEKEMSSIFFISEYNEFVPVEYKECIHRYFIQNDFLYGEKRDKYFLTTIKSRAKDVIAFGDLSNQDSNAKPDIAFLLEENDFKSNFILFFCILQKIIKIRSKKC